MLERNAPSLLWFELSFSLESQEVFFILLSVQDPPMVRLPWPLFVSANL